MGMPDLEGLAGTVLLIDQHHLFHPGGPPEAGVLTDAAEPSSVLTGRRSEPGRVSSGRGIAGSSAAAEAPARPAGRGALAGPGSVLSLGRTERHHGVRVTPDAPPGAG